MRYLILALFLCGVLGADVSISVKADKSSLSISEKLNVDITLHYPPSNPPDVFAFLYNLTTTPQLSFQVASTAVDGSTIHVALQPKHTGKLIFAPGIITFSGVPYIVPPVTAECTSTGVTSLPVAGLLPLYPEHRIELTPANRMRLMSQSVLQEASQENKLSYGKYRIARDALAFFMGIVAFGSLAIWGIIYYDILEQRKRPPPVTITPLEQSIRDLEEAEPLSWPALITALRLAIGQKEGENYQSLSAFELADKVQSSPNLTQEDKATLTPILTTLGRILYAQKPTSTIEWQELCREVLHWFYSLPV